MSLLKKTKEESMKDKERPSLGGCALLFALIHLFEYGVEHIVYLLRDAAWSGLISLDSQALGVISLIAEYAVDAIEIASVAVMALILLISLSQRSVAKTAMLGICMLLTKVIYIFPHYYMTFISYGYDSIETIVMIIPLALFIILISAATLTLTVAIALLPALLKARKSGSACLDVLGDDLECGEFTNLGNSSTSAIGIIAILSSLIHVAIAIADTVNAFIKYGASLPPSVMFSIMGRFLFLLAILVILHFSLCLIRNAFMGKEAAADNKDGVVTESSAAVTNEDARTTDNPNGDNESAGSLSPDKTEIDPADSPTEPQANES